MGTLDGKVAMITGAARGIGRATARKLAAEGARVVACDLGDAHDQVRGNAYALATGADLLETCNLVAHGASKCLAVNADVRSSEQMRAAAERAAAEFGRIDILAACAGISSFASLLEMKDETWNGIIEVNLTGVANTLRAVIPHMIKHKFGRIVVVGSIAARKGMADNSAYVASKWGLVGLVKTAALELERYGITANLVHPGPVDTMMNRNPAVIAWKGKEPGPGDLMPASAIADGIAFLASDAARYISGAGLDISESRAATFN